MRWCLSFWLLMAVPVAAEIAVPPGMDVVILGEIHDNPAHHAEQARLVAALNPTAVVWEMLTPAQLLAAAGADLTDARAYGAALGWQAAGWPDFAMYHPIFLASAGVPQFGAAVDRATMMRAMSDGVAAAFGPQADAFGLGPLDATDQAAREAEQAEAHCGALPADLLPGMVAVQRLRDAKLALVALDAVRVRGGPVVVITGTGHARRDTGIPAALRHAAPDLKVWSLGQLEEAPGPDAPFDAVNVTAPAPREDPCLQLQSGEGAGGG